MYNNVRTLITLRFQKSEWNLYYNLIIELPNMICSISLDPFLASLVPVSSSEINMKLTINSVPLP